MNEHSNVPTFVRALICMYVFMQITCEQVKEFTKTISTFHDKFSEEGPGTVGTDLDEGTCVYMRMSPSEGIHMNGSCMTG